MARVYGVLTLVVLTLIREWKATTALLIALYVAIALVSFLDRSMIWMYRRY
jgi:ABC-type phosphate transport system permease subunit